MTRAAVPDYINMTANSASIGMRFNMYLSIWMDQQEQQRILEARAGKGSDEAKSLRREIQEYGLERTIKYQVSQGRLEEIWERKKGLSADEWQKIAHFNQSDLDLIQAWQERQVFLASLMPEQRVLQFTVNNNAPLATGLGNAHPLENGFAFLWPYGLPYLPGSSIKGVMRQAARDWLAEQTEEALQPYIESLKQWSFWQELGLSAESLPEDIIIQILFGWEGEDEVKFQGLLRFLDIIPHFQEKGLQVEIMNPHYGHYYRDGEPPHDSGQPIPIYFLTIPAGTEFCFTLIYDQRLELDWKPLIQKIIEYGFNWLGFGAKTAVGYGDMDVDSFKLTERIKAQSTETTIEPPLKKLSLVEQWHQDTAHIGLISKENNQYKDLQEIIDIYLEKAQSADAQDKQALLAAMQQTLDEKKGWYSPDVNSKRRKKKKKELKEKLEQALL